MIDFKGKTLLLFGDSIMHGAGNGGYGVGEYLEKELGVVLKKYCVGGARVGYCEGKNWLVEQVKAAIKDGVRADLIIFNGFTNDCWKDDGVNCDVPLGEPLADSEYTDIFSVEKSATFTQCFESIVNAFEKYFGGAPVIFVRPHKMGRRGAEEQKIYGERALEICRQHGIAVADIYEDGAIDTFLPSDRDKYTFDSYGWGRGDCTHPNALCYEQVYIPLILQTIKNLRSDK